MNPNVPDAAELAKFDKDFADAPVDETTESVPDAKYQVNVDKVELTKAKSTGNPMLKWTLRILGPKYVNRFLWRNNVMLTKENIRWLKADLHTCGLDLKKLSDLPANLEKLLDVKLEVTKRTKGDSENVYFNRRIVLDDIPDEGSGDSGTADADIPF